MSFNTFSDGEVLGNLLPLEIWSIILKMIQRFDSNCLLQLYKSSQYFQELLETRRTQFYFGPVFEILRANVNWDDVKPKIATRSTFLKPTYLKNGESETDKDDDKIGIIEDENGFFEENETKPMFSDLYYCDTCRSVITVTWISNILNLRFICKVWKESIDDYYSKHNEEEINWFITLPIMVTDVLKHFSKTHSSSSNANPFLYGKTRVFGGEPNLGFSDTLKLLKKYGKFFKELEVRMLWLEPDVVTVEFPRLQNILVNTQNVKFVKICAFDDLWLEQSNLKLDFQLPELEYVAVGDSKTGKLLRYLLSIAPNVKKLDMSGQFGLPCHQESGIACSQEFHNLNLTHLKVELSEKINKCLFQCFRFKFLQCLEIKINPFKFYIPLNSLLMYISNNWKHTLKEFSLTYTRKRSLDESFMMSYPGTYLDNPFILCQEFLDEMLSVTIREDCLQLEKLQRIKMCIQNCVISTNFLRSLKNTLEEVDIVIDFRPKAADEAETVNVMLTNEKIDFERMARNKADQKNLWKLFPKLKKLNYELKSTYKCSSVKKDGTELNINCALVRK